jgi:hypothetical protein
MIRQHGPATPLAILGEWLRDRGVPRLLDLVLVNRLSDVFWECAQREAPA